MSDFETQIQALDDAIEALRKADRWRLRKRNKLAITTTKAARQRLLVAHAGGLDAQDWTEVFERFCEYHSQPGHFCKRGDDCPGRLGPESSRDR